MEWRKENLHLIYLIQKQPFADILENDVLKSFTKFTEKYLCWSHFFNTVACLKTWNFIKKRLQHRYFPVNFSKNIIYRTPLVDCSCWFLCSNPSFIHWSLSSFFLISFFSFIIDNCNYGSLFRKGIEMKIYLLFTIIYPKINTNVVKTILAQQ